MRHCAGILRERLVFQSKYFPLLLLFVRVRFVIVTAVYNCELGRICPVVDAASIAPERCVEGIRSMLADHSVSVAMCSLFVFLDQLLVGETIEGVKTALVFETMQQSTFCSVNCYKTVHATRCLSVSAVP
jgi:hypothetical protein